MADSVPSAGGSRQTHRPPATRQRRLRLRGSAGRVASWWGGTPRGGQIISWWRRLPIPPIAGHAIRRAGAWYARRPFRTTWAVLATGMVLMLVLFGLDTGLTVRQHATLAVIAVGLAWLCTWIIFLERDPTDGR